jgi:hypothetical protein
MSNSSSWLSRLCCCRRQKQQAYIYLYSPQMPGSSSSHCCLICILFGLCLAVIVILAAVVIYHLNSSDSISKTTSNTFQSVQPTGKKRQLPDFINDKIDPCQYFYEFVCDKLIQKKNLDKFIQQEFQQKWTHIQHEIHEKLMTDINQPLRSNESMYLKHLR